MKLAFDQPDLLWLGLASLPGLFGAAARTVAVASLLDAPPDPLSRLLDGVLRLLAALPILLIALGLAGLHLVGARRTEITTGAHIITVLDRSLSMGEPFALRGQNARESKTDAAARMIGAFFARNPHDRFGLVGFSTAPIQVMPLTEHRAAMEAAIAAMHHGQLGDTDIGSGIAYASAMFAEDDPAAPHVIVLVTDGAGDIPERVRVFLRSELRRVHAHLYYLYLRAGDDPPLLSGNPDDTDMQHPEALDSFFRSLGIPYQGFEASDAGAIDATTRRIEAIERHPVATTETLPRRPLARACFGAAALLLGLSVAASLAERRALRPQPA